MGPHTGDVNVAHYTDLMIGVVPVINLEWIQKINRDTNLRGYSREAVTDVILSRMPDYVHYIVPHPSIPISISSAYRWWIRPIPSSPGISRTPASPWWSSASAIRAAWIFLPPGDDQGLLHVPREHPRRSWRQAGHCDAIDPDALDLKLMEKKKLA